MFRNFVTITLSLLFSSSTLADTYSWSNPAGGTWWDENHWNGPDPDWIPATDADDVRFDLAGFYTVDIFPPAGEISLGWLDVANSGATINGSFALQYDTAVVNNGVINGGLLFTNSATLGGTGRVQELHGDPGVAVEQQAGHSMLGPGGVYVDSFINYGTLAAELGILVLAADSTTSYTDLETRGGHFNAINDVDGPAGWIAVDGGLIEIGAMPPDFVTNITTEGPVILHSPSSPFVTELAIGCPGCDVEMHASNLYADELAMISIQYQSVLVISGDVDYATQFGLFTVPDSELRMTGGSGGGCDAGNWAKFEVGASPVDPFFLVFHHFTVAENAGVALVDQRDNSFFDPEVLRVNVLEIRAGGTLNLNGHSLFISGVPVTPGPYGAGQIVDLALCEGPACQPCDVDCNGTINPFDIQPFIDLLGANPPSPCSPCAADADGNGTINPFDIQNFLDCLGS